MRGQSPVLSPEFTKGDLKREFFTIIPSLQRGRGGDGSSYMVLVKWHLRTYADEKAPSGQDTLFHGASREDSETENEVHVRLPGLRHL